MRMKNAIDKTRKYKIKYEMKLFLMVFQARMNKYYEKNQKPPRAPTFASYLPSEEQLALEIQGRNIEQDYRDLDLDRSRAEYELEFKTNLGDAMVNYSRSNEARLRTLYAYELAYQRLAALVGEDFLTAKTIAE